MIVIATYENHDMFIKMHKTIKNADELMNFLNDFSDQLSNLDIKPFVSGVSKKEKGDTIEFDFDDLESASQLTWNATAIKTEYLF